MQRDMQRIKKREAATYTSHTSAPESTATVAPFRAWRGSQFIAARGPIQATIDILSTRPKRTPQKGREFYQ